MQTISTRRILFLQCLCVVFFTFHLSKGNSQTQFWIETFGTATCAARGTLANGFNSGNGPWTQTNGANGAAANQWYVSPTEANMGSGICSNGCIGNAALTNSTLHISAIGGLCGTPDCGAAYNATGASNVTNRRIESPTISCVGLSGISLNFLFIGNGQGVLDNCIVWYFNGTVWATLADPPVSGLCGGFACTFLGICQGVWTPFTIALPASANNNPNVRIGFQWVNNGDGVGSDPSFAVDNVRLLYTTPLPVQLSSFNGQCNDHGVTLNWSTESEVNNDYFKVEKSLDAITWDEIGRIQGKGNSNVMNSYSFLDDKAGSLGYYRLSQVDFDGTTSTFYPISIACNNPADDISIYPNPTTGIVTITSNDQLPLQSVDVVNLQGQVMEQVSLRTSGNNTNSMINLSHLEAGSYLLRIHAGNHLVTKPLILIR